jgi:hypothetical protein
VFRQEDHPVRRYWLLVAFALGCVVGWVATSDPRERRSAPPGAIDWARPVRVQCPDGPHPTLVLQPYSVTLDARITHFGPPPEKPADRWLVILDGGRVSLACARDTTP